MKKKNQSCHGSVRKFFLVLASLCFILLPQKIKAGQTPDFFADPVVLSASLLAPVATMHDMLGERLIVEAMPAYWTVSFNGGNAEGYGGALAIKYEFTPNWGMALLGSHGWSQEFSTTKTLFADPGARLISSKYKLDRSSAVAFTITYDPFSEPGGFRLPIFIGAVSGKAKVSGTETTENSLGNRGTVTVDNETTNELNFVFGLSAEFNVWKFRFEPALVAINSEGSTLTWKHSDGRTESKSHGSYRPTEFLLGIKYVPWGLRYAFQITDVDNLTIHSLTWTKSW